MWLLNVHPAIHGLAVWKYNLRSHLLHMHGNSDPDLYNELWNVERLEEDRIKMAWNKILNPRKSNNQRKILDCQTRRVISFLLYSVMSVLTLVY